VNRTSRQLAGNVKPVTDESQAQNYAVMLQRTFESGAAELIWIAELMTGSRQAAQECIAEAIQLAETAQYVGSEWILPWLKRLVVHVCLHKMSAEFRQWLPSPSSRKPARVVKLGLTESELRKVRSIPPREIVASCDVLERACFIMSAYLRYSLLDCALLLGVPRDWIEPVCERAFMKILDVVLSVQDQLREIDSFISPGVMRCQAD